VRHERDIAEFVLERLSLEVLTGEHQVVGSEVLRGEDAVEGFEGEMSPVVQEIGQMRLSKARLPRKKRNADSSPLDPPQQLEAKTFVHVRKIHL
jgi:hypothetical protein